MSASADSVLLLCWLGGTVSAVVLWVLAVRHAKSHFRLGDVFYMALAAILSLYGGALLLVMWMFKDGWHS